MLNHTPCAITQAEIMYDNRISPEQEAEALRCERALDAVAPEVESEMQELIAFLNHSELLSDEHRRIMIDQFEECMYDDNDIYRAYKDADKRPSDAFRDPWLREPKANTEQVKTERFVSDIRLWGCAPSETLQED